MLDPATMTTLSRLGAEAKSLWSAGLEATKTVTLDSVRAQLSGGGALDSLARETGWSVTSLQQNADQVLRVEGTAGTSVVETSLNAGQCVDVHSTAHEHTAHNKQGEVLGLEATKHYLAEQGFTCIQELGGGGEGGAMPDIVCRGVDGRPWVVEVKGTQTGTKLKDMGLDRGPDGAGGTVWENSPDWLQRSGEKTLEAMDAHLAECPDFELQALRDDYAGLVENGFDDHEAYGNMVAQAGDNLTALDPSNLQGKIADYANEVDPDCIVQIRTDTVDV